MANSGGLKTSKRYVPNCANHLLHLHDRSREVVSVWICYLPFVSSMWESEETPIRLMCAWHISSLSWEQMSALFTNVGSNVGYNSTVGIATSEMNSDQTFCGFQLQLVCVLFSFSKSWERTGVGLSTMLSSYNNIYMRRETFINVLPLQQHLCKQKPQNARNCKSRCLTTVPASRELSGQPGKQKMEETHKKSLCGLLVTEQIVWKARIWGRQVQFTRSWATTRVYCHWPKTTSP